MLLFLFFIGDHLSSQGKYLFDKYSFDNLKTKIYKVFTTSNGKTFILTSTGLCEFENGKLTAPIISTKEIYKVNDQTENTNNYPYHWNISKVDQDPADNTRGSFCQDRDGLCYFIAYNKFFVWKYNNKIHTIDWPISGFSKIVPVLKIWVDNNGTIYVGTKRGGLYILELEKTMNDSTHNIVSVSLKKLKTIGWSEISIFSFAQDIKNKNKIWMGTSAGLMTYNINQGNILPIVLNDRSRVTITEVYPDDKDNIWFSTLEKGMGVYNQVNKSYRNFPYTNEIIGKESTSQIEALCYKSPSEFFVSRKDNFPAIFNTKDNTYKYINDSFLKQSSYQTTNVQINRQGYLLYLKGGTLYHSRIPKNETNSIIVKSDSSNNADSPLIPFIKAIEFTDGTPLASLDYRSHLLQKIVLDYKQNNLIVYCDVNDFNNKKEIGFGWNMNGYSSGWQLMSKTNVDSTAIIYLQGLAPGTYKLQVRVKRGINNWTWENKQAELIIIVVKPIWQLWWFWTAIIACLALIIYVIVKLRVKAVRKQERLKSEHEKQLLELEAKALRSQMNPHFIFNCLNSIKSLIQEHHEEKSVTYLTTFSKLIRTLFNNADKKEITLYDEIETCKLYLQLEAMRFDSKFSYAVNVDETFDLKSILIPALIIQPFIENAIWHGIVPKENSGHVSVSVGRSNGNVEITIDDNGIGREASHQNKGSGNIGHQSKGVNLTQSRLELDNLLQQRQASLETIDKTNESGKATGTTVIIRLPQEE